MRKYRCVKCRTPFESDQHVPICPRCKVGNPTLLGGVASPEDADGGELGTFLGRNARRFAFVATVAGLSFVFFQFVLPRIVEMDLAAFLRPDTVLQFKLVNTSPHDFDLIITTPNGESIDFRDPRRYRQDGIHGGTQDAVTFGDPLPGNYAIGLHCYATACNAAGEPTEGAPALGIEVWLDGELAKQWTFPDIQGPISEHTDLKSYTYLYEENAGV